VGRDGGCGANIRDMRKARYTGGKGEGGAGEKDTHIADRSEESQKTYI